MKIIRVAAIFPKYQCLDGMKILGGELHDNLSAEVLPLDAVKLAHFSFDTTYGPLSTTRTHIQK